VTLTLATSFELKRNRRWTPGRFEQLRLHDGNGDST